MEACLPVAEWTPELQARLHQPPASAEEYLARTRREAASMGPVLRAAPGPREAVSEPEPEPEPEDAFAGFSSVEPCPAELRADPEWEAAALADFAQLRATLEVWEPLFRRRRDVELPQMADEAGWQRFCFGPGRGVPPFVRVVLQMDVVMTTAVLRHHIDWLVEGQPVSRARALWLYGLLARLSQPAPADVSSDLRLLLRHVCAQRAGLPSGSGEARELPALSLLAVVLGKAFGQSEY